MKRISIFITLLLFISTSRLFACDCGESDLKKIDERSYKYSDLIIIGDVVKTGENYKIKVIEVLKGEEKDKIIRGTVTDERGYTNSCFTIPREKGRYIFYLNEIKKGKYFYSYSSCSGSRPLNMSVYPISLKTKMDKSELISETNNWIEILRENRNKL
ncbi:hypothetical protein [Paenimyroides baculatum]|uniref:Tissue inhibitor of metalloproteinase n=1 Tax=Paenimyroides baculatum TaxID=2608000 RepID=A0A5M6CPX9_9FLAO|nr:hypothetical protein [Paenimyroides baculatum]KAA5536042.1 hypothetical protein F0460_06335 [Paenimyroides baculatum]